jgi:WD40 repeat protein
MLASGSYDTNVKIWDTRLKNCLHVLKAHSRQVCSLALSPDSRYVLSGSEDTTAQCYDLRMMKPVFEYAVGANVLSLAFHKHSMVFAAGCSDRMARLYQLSSPYSLIASTRNETMPVVNTCFYGKNFLFTAASESLKVWDIKKGCVMTDII